MSNILIIKLGSLGDVLRTTCVLSGLHEKYPNAQISWITSPEAYPLLSENTLISEVILLRNLADLTIVNKLFDLIISLDDDELACRVASILPKKFLIGAYEHNGKRCYTENSSKWFNMGLISLHGKTKADELKKSNNQSYPTILYEILDIQPGHPVLSIPSQYRDFAQNFVQQNIHDKKPIVGLNTGAGTRWRYKRFSEKKTAGLADLLIGTLDVSIILLGGPNEIERNRTIRRLSKYEIINSGNKNDLLQFSALIDTCNLMITSDSLALHISSALGVPTIAFFGPTSANEIDLITPGSKIQPVMDCLCCYKNDCDIRPTCMDNISLKEICDAAHRVLSAQSNLYLS